MTLVNADTGELVAELTPDEARSLTDRIRTSLQDVQALVIEAHQREAWRALGYNSWQDYVSGEFDERPPLQLPREMRVKVHREMSAARMSQRAIAAATGADQATVSRDLSGDANASPDAEPKTVTGLDGKTYDAKKPPASKPKRTPLPDAAQRAGWEFRKSTERLQRIQEDDRFGANAQQVAAHLRGHLEFAIEVCQDLLDGFDTEG